MHFFSWLLFFTFFRLSSVGLEFVDFCWVITGVEETWLSTCFPDLKIWTTLHWFGWLSWALWTGKKFFRLVNGWLGNAPFCLSLSELANWLIWTSNLLMAYLWLFIIEAWVLYKFFMALSRSVIFLSGRGFWKECCGAWCWNFGWKLGWKLGW